MSRRIRIATVMAVAGLAGLPASASASARAITAYAHVRASVATGGGSLSSAGSLTHVIPLRVRNPAARSRLQTTGPSRRAAASPAGASPIRDTAIFGGTLDQPGLSAADEFSFVGGEPGVTPPDSTGAIGPFQYIEIVNSEIAMWSRADLSMIGSRVNLDTFDAGSNSCDPQVKYDPQSGRWFYLALQCGSGTNELFLGWSKTSNPSDLTSSNWCRFTLPTTPGTSFDDYPKLGLDADHIIIGTNLFDATTETFQTAHILAGPKPPAGTLTSCGAPPTFTVFGSPASPLMASSGNPAFTPEPATVSDGSSQTGYIIAADQDPNTGDGSNLMLWHIAGTAASPTLVAEGDVPVSSFSAPLEGISQPGSTDRIDPMDGRLTQAVMAKDPNAAGAEAIWTQHTIDNGSGGTEVRWYEVVPSTAALRQSGTITDSAGFAFNGAIAPTLNGGAVINYNAGGATQDVEVKAQARNGTDALGTMTALASALATSTAIDSDLSCPSNDPTQPFCRWGDYAGASADPACPDVSWGSSQITIPAVNPPDAQWQAQNFAVTPSSAPLLACFTATPNPVDTGSTVNFDASDSRDSGGTPSSWTWDFGDGSSTQTGKTKTHSYSSPGTYTVTLTVGDGTHSATASELITVVGTPTVSSFGASPDPQTVGSPVSFDASSASDSGTTLTYTWDFGDGSSVSGPNAGVTHTYRTAGQKTVSLTVSDGFGHSAAQVQKTITIDGPPSASFSAGPDPVAAGSPVSFDGSPSTDPGTTITSYSWNFGDGSTGTGVSPSHAYAAAGTYTATLMVADAFGETASTSRSVTVVGPLSASFTANPNPGTAGQPVALNAGGSSDPGAAITIYSWNFGDGSVGAGSNVSHSYGRPGSYTVTLVTSDNAGQTATTTRVLTIRAPALSGSLSARKTQRRTAVLKHGLTLGVSVSEGVSVSFVITRPGKPAKRHGKPTTVTVLRATRPINAGASQITFKLSSRRLPTSGRVTLTVQVVLRDVFGQTLPRTIKVTLT